MFLLVMEVFVIKNSIQTVLQASEKPVVVSKDQGVRIDFTGYNEAIQRIQNAQTFQPDADINADPFNPPPVAPAASATTTPATGD